MFKLELEKAEESEIKLPEIKLSDHQKSKRVPEKTSTSAKAFDCVDHKKLWKILQEMEYQTT